MFRALVHGLLEYLLHSSRSASGLICLAVLIFAPAESRAWGIVGHRIVCELAYDLLKSEARDEVDTLVASFVKPNGKKFKHFIDSCHFADTARHNARDGKRKWQSYARFDHWHYVNVPRDTHKFDASSLRCERDCVLHAIDSHARILADKTKATGKRGEALILLAHWVADIHQPMHVSFADDRGGSKILLDPKRGLGRHLHAAWDAGIIKKYRGKQRLTEYIGEQRLRVLTEQEVWRAETNPIVWAAESYAVVTSPEAHYCQWREVIAVKGTTQRRCEQTTEKAVIDEAYVSRTAPILEKRLRQAAARLANLLERKLGVN